MIPNPEPGIQGLYDRGDLVRVWSAPDALPLIDLVNSTGNASEAGTDADEDAIEDEVKLI